MSGSTPWCWWPHSLPVRPRPTCRRKGQKCRGASWEHGLWAERGAPEVPHGSSVQPNSRPNYSSPKGVLTTGVHLKSAQ